MIDNTHTFEIMVVHEIENLFIMPPHETVDITVTIDDLLGREDTAQDGFS